MTVPRQNQLAWKITLSIVHSLAFIWTALRLYRRFKTRLWWDDAAIIVAIVVDAFYFSHIFLKYTGPTFRQRNFGQNTSLLLSPWFGGFLYMTVIWFSRISLILSIGRVFSGRPRIHKVAIGLAGWFFLSYAAVNISSALDCDRIKGAPWYVIDLHKCVVVTGSGDTLAAIMGLLLSFLADIIFIAFPLLLAKTMPMRRRTRLLLSIIFCGGFIAVGIGIAFASMYYCNRGHPDIMVIFYVMAHLQATCGLLICNLVVDLFIVYGFFHKTTGLSTFVDGAYSEGRRNGRAGAGTQRGRGNGSDSSTRDSASIERITLTPISSAMQTDSNTSDAQGIKEAEA